MQNNALTYDDANDKKTITPFSNALFEKPIVA
jgi:hypothetical protein